MVPISSFPYYEDEGTGTKKIDFFFVARNTLPIALYNAYSQPRTALVSSLLHAKSIMGSAEIVTDLPSRLRPSPRPPIGIVVHISDLKTYLPIRPKDSLSATPLGSPDGQIKHAICSHAGGRCGRVCTCTGQLENFVILRDISGRVIRKVVGAVNHRRRSEGSCRANEDYGLILLTKHVPQVIDYNESLNSTEHTSSIRLMVNIGYNREYSESPMTT